MKGGDETKLKRSLREGNCRAKVHADFTIKGQKAGSFQVGFTFVSRFVSSKSGLVKPFVGYMKRKKRTFIRKGIEYIDSREKSLELRFTELWGID